VEKPVVDRLDSIEAFLGSRVHDTLEQLYRDVRMHRATTEQEMLDDFEQRWLKQYHGGIRIVRKRYTAENYFLVGRRCLQDYFRRHQPFDQTRTLGLEERIVIDLDMRGEYKLQGYIDRVAQRADGHYEIHDYKTSNSLPTPERFNADRQLALYQIGVERRFGDAQRVDLVWHYLQFDREIRSRRDPSELDQLRFDTVGTIQTIQAESAKGEFPARESALCDWCEYMSICPAKKHLFSLQDATPEMFHEDDGVKLVEEWITLQNVKQEAVRTADLRLAVLRDAIVAYAQRHELEVIVGADHKLRVKLRQGYKVPTKSDDPAALQALSQRLQKLGLWPRVSTLDRHAVLRLLESGDLSEEDRDQLESRLVPDAGARISVSKLKDSERVLDT
jgi:putative RecB family exonuclease